MHRTSSVDYGTILHGEIALVLDGGEETVLKAGDVYVQRGTNHSWVNRGTCVCRMTFVAVSRDEIASLPVPVPACQGVNESPDLRTG